MTFSELLSNFCEPDKIALVATATNGLKPQSDRLLGVTIGNQGNQIMLLRKTDLEDLEKAQDYHRISYDLMTTAAYGEGDFKSAVELKLKDKYVFTYNPSFQYSFLTQVMEEEDLRLMDLTVIYKALEQGMQFSDEDCGSMENFYAACQIYNAIPVNKLVTKLGISRLPVPGQLPMERMVQVLHKLLERSYPLEVSVL